jgi:predicted transcriptional regulator
MMLRLDPELAERLRTVAEAENRSIAGVVGEAITTLDES